MQAVFERHQRRTSESLADNQERIRLAETGLQEAQAAGDAALAGDFQNKIEVAAFGAEVNQGRADRALHEYENLTSRTEGSVGDMEADVSAAWNALEANRAAGGSPVPTLVPASRP